MPNLYGKFQNAMHDYLINYISLYFSSYDNTKYEIPFAYSSAYCVLYIDDSLIYKLFSQKFEILCHYIWFFSFHV